MSPPECSDMLEELLWFNSSRGALAELQSFSSWLLGASLKPTSLELGPPPSIVTAPSRTITASSLAVGQERPRRSNIIPAPDTPHLIVPHTSTDSSPFAHGDTSSLLAPQLALRAAASACPAHGCYLLPTVHDRCCALCVQSPSTSLQPAAASKQPSNNLEGWLAGWAALAAASKPPLPAGARSAQPAPTAAATGAGPLVWPTVRTRPDSEAISSGPSKRARVSEGEAPPQPASADAMAAFKAAWAHNVACALAPSIQRSPLVCMRA